MFLLNIFNSVDGELIASRKKFINLSLFKSLQRMKKKSLFILFFHCIVFTANAQTTLRHDAPDSTVFTFSYGGIIRGDSTKKEIALVFTGDEFGDGLSSIAETLQKQNIKGSFFFTGRFYRNKSFQPY